MKTACAVVLCLLIALAVASAAVPPVAPLTRDAGGSIQTKMGGTVVLNAGSSLAREWITFHDDSIPAELVGTIGIQTDLTNSMEYKYTAKYTLKAREALTAIEVRFLLFDIWGNHLNTLTATDVIDIDTGTTREFAPRWNLFSENEASEYYASIAYVARVRTKAGKVVEAKIAPVLDEAKRFSAKFSEEDLEPRPDKK